MNDRFLRPEITILPCGGDCGTSYTMPGLVGPVVIQRAALDDGCGIAEVDGDAVLVCQQCRRKSEGD